MRIDPMIKRELDTLPVPYTIQKSKDHYFAIINGHRPICIGGNHDKHKWSLVKKTVADIRKIRQKLEAAKAA